MKSETLVMVEAEKAAPQTESGVLYCTVHPTVETALRCNRCGRPMCNRCAVRTPVGYRCRECVRGQQEVFYNARTLDPVIQATVGFVLGGIAAAVIGLVSLGFLGWLIAFWAGSAAGALIADVAYRAVGKRRGRYSWLVVAGSIVVSGLSTVLFTGLSLTSLIFVLMAASGAVGRLRLGR